MRKGTMNQRGYTKSDQTNKFALRKENLPANDTASVLTGRLDGGAGGLLVGNCFT